MKIGDRVPVVDLPIRVAGDFTTLNTGEEFKGRRVVLFALPGAFTPTCSTYQLPGFERDYELFLTAGVEEIYCLSVNDAFVMDAWFESQGIKNVKALPDGSAEFTRRINQNVQKDNLGFGVRSWRYAIVINDGVIEQVFSEEGIADNAGSDPYEVSTPENVLKHI